MYVPLRAAAATVCFFYTLLTLYACSPAQPAALPDSPPRPEPENPVTVLSILQSQGENSLALQQAAELFVGDRADIKIQIRTIEKLSDYRIAVRQGLLEDGKVDLFHIFSCREALELKPHLQNLSSLTWVGGAAGDLEAPMRLEDGIYGVPCAADGFGLIANRNIFEAAGIPLADIRDYEDLEEAFEALDAMIQNGDLADRFPALEAVTELPAQDREFLSQLCDIGLLGEFSAPRQAVDAPGLPESNAEGFRRYLDLMARYSAGTSASKALLPANRQVEEGLAIGRVAVIQQSVGVYRSVFSLNPSLSPRLALLPIPLPPAREEESGEAFVYLRAPAYWAVNSRSSDEQKRLAYSFLTWLYQTDTGQAMLAGNFGAISPYREFAKDTAVSLHRQLLGLMEQNRTRLALAREAPENYLSQSFAPLLQSYLSRENDWKHAVLGWREGWTG